MSGALLCDIRRESSISEFLWSCCLQFAKVAMYIASYSCSLTKKRFLRSITANFVVFVCSVIIWVFYKGGLRPTTNFPCFRERAPVLFFSGHARPEQKAGSGHGRPEQKAGSGHGRPSPVTGTSLRPPPSPGSNQVPDPGAKSVLFSNMRQQRSSGQPSMLTVRASHRSSKLGFCQKPRQGPTFRVV